MEGNRGSAWWWAIVAVAVLVAAGAASWRLMSEPGRPSAAPVRQVVPVVALPRPTAVPRAVPRLDPSLMAGPEQRDRAGALFVPISPFGPPSPVPTLWPPGGPPSPVPSQTPTPTATNTPSETPTQPTATPTATQPTATPTATQPTPTPAPPGPAAGIPVRLRIPWLGINTAVEQVGMTKGVMDVPSGWWTVGWFKLGPRPGEPGNSVIDGHLDSTTGAAIFLYLHNLRLGDLIYVTDNLGKERAFAVTELQSYADDAAPMQRIFGNSSTAHLNLITCNGTWLTQQHTYNQRLVVYTTLVRGDGHGVRVGGARQAAMFCWLSAMVVYCRK